MDPATLIFDSEFSEEEMNLRLRGNDYLGLMVSAPSLVPEIGDRSIIRKNLFTSEKKAWSRH